MKKYNWQQPDWPNFTYSLSEIEDRLFSIAEKMGAINGKFSHFSEQDQSDALIDLMVEEAANSSEIEGERINRPDVRSSIKNKLGLNHPKEPIHDKRAQGISELMVDVRQSFKQPLTDTKLFEWHKMVMSGYYHQNTTIGNWRSDDELMQIISGYEGKKTIHFEAPPSKLVSNEMRRFINWFNLTAPGEKQEIPFPPVRAAIAHLYFESIHPFDDGNGRIGRAIAEKALSQGFGYPVMLSLSKTIEANKKSYYQALNIASKSNEISHWIKYFIDTIFQAEIDMENEIDFILKKVKFFNKYKDKLNERQIKAIKRMMKAGYKGFEGGMTAKKYMKITDISKPTATRDLQHLSKINALIMIGSGRNVRYELNL